MRQHVVTTAVEHSAVLRAAERTAEEGYTVERVGVDSEGRVAEDEWREKITDRTALVSIQHVNNETGVIQDISRLAAAAAERGAIVHVDAVQSAGKLPIDVSSWPVHLLSLSAHKIHGPKGTGALYVRRRTRLQPVLVGGGQESRMRGGTENVAGIVGMGVAAEAVSKDAARVAAEVGEMRDLLEQGILRVAPGGRVNGCGAARVYNTTNISFEGLEAEAILLLLSEAGIWASSGSACSSGSLEPSHVLQAMGVEERFAHGAVRFSLSRFNTREEIDQVLSVLPGLLDRLTTLCRG